MATWLIERASTTNPYSLDALITHFANIQKRSKKERLALLLMYRQV